MSRPATSKPRGVCRYYNQPRGCFAADKCKFLHGAQDDPLLLTPYDKSKRCRYYADGFCKRGESCWFLHAPMDDDDEPCSICFEKPMTYGLLGGCSHIFCITCIRQWRDPQNKPGGVLDSGNTKKCPMCRSPSKFITPCSKFWKDGTEEKVKVVQTYKESMARVPCRYFQKSLQKDKANPLCPYGKDCFYQHIKEDGTPHIFKDGVDECMKKYRRSQGQRLSFDLTFIPMNIAYDADMAQRGFDFLTINGARDNRQRDANGVEYAARRLREVGRSLELLNDAITEGATLENLNLAVGTLRAGLRRLEGGVVTDRELRRWVSEQPAGAEDDGAEEENEVMERLETLADQMLASINTLRIGGEARESPGNGADTPLEQHRQVFDQDSDNESMPALNSMSNSSESDFGDSESSDDERDALDLVRGIVGSWSTANLAVPEPGSGSSSRASPRFSTVVDRRILAEDEDMPDLEPIEDPLPSTRADEENKRPSDAFTTDGRGRVISVGGSETGGDEAESSISASEPGGDGGGGGGGGGPGRSILGWINALF